MIIILQTLVLLTSFVSLYITLISFINKNVNSAILFYPVFFLVYPLQLILDLIYGMPNYSVLFTNFAISYNDYLTNVIYLILIFLLGLVLIYLQVSLPKIYLPNVKEKIKSNVFFKLIIILSILSPLIPLFNFPDISILFVYGKIRDYIGTDIYKAYSIIPNLTLLSSLVIVYIRYTERNKLSKTKFFLYLLILCINIYLNNKRTIYFIFILFFVVDYYFSENKIRSTLKVLFVTLIASYLYVWYTNAIKYSDFSSVDEYAQYRIELGRDDVLKFSIYKNLVVNEPILEYYGQTIYGTLVGYIPRELIEQKPYPYAQYLTNSLLFDKVGAALIGWAMTTSIVDEMISNFKYFGFGFIVIFYYLFLKIANNIFISNVSTLYFLIFTLWHFVHGHVFLLLVYLAIFISLYKLSKKILIKI